MKHSEYIDRPGRRSQRHVVWIATSYKDRRVMAMSIQSVSVNQRAWMRTLV